MIPLLVTIPHSGEKVPERTPWLTNLPEEILMCDVDRYVDVLYEPALKNLQIPYVKTEWHRYAADLNRIPEDIDAGTVVGAPLPAGTHPRGFHWAITTYEQKLMPGPMPKKTHDELVQLIYEPFHKSVQGLYQNFADKGAHVIYHIDAHSMPSLGTNQHRDPGEYRADIVVSDCKGKSCKPEFKDLVMHAYSDVGFKVAYNWPYFGGRVTEQYGEPQKQHHAVQVEMNRALYMDEKTKKIKPELVPHVQVRVKKALELIQKGLEAL